MFHYTAYGLTLSSDRGIPELPLAADATPDITIRHGAVPDSLDNPSLQSVCYQAAAGEFLLAVPGIARYLVQEGRRITIDPAPAAADDAVRLFLHNTVLGALLQQRGLLVFHGSAIATDRGAILFLGPSAKGKSSLAAEFGRRGYRVLADEVCGIEIRSDGPWIRPSYPHLQLWADTIEKLGLSFELLRRVRSSLEKYYVTVEPFSMAPVPVLSAYILDCSNSPGFSNTTVHGLAKFRELSDQSFHHRFVKGMQLLKSHFAQVQVCAIKLRVARIERPRHSFLLRELADLVENDRS